MAVKSLGVAFALASLSVAGCSHASSTSLGDARSANVAAQSAKPVGSAGALLLRPSFATCEEKSEGVTFAMQSCMEIEFRYQNGRLRSVYGSLLQSQDLRSRRSTERLQAEWLAERDRKCAWDAVHGGQAQRLEANYCSMQDTAQRAAELEKMLASAK